MVPEARPGETLLLSHMATGLCGDPGGEAKGQGGWGSSFAQGGEFCSPSQRTSRSTNSNLSWSLLNLQYNCVRTDTLSSLKG